jgi:site-specific DNA-methyltransferase (adenine-specific)
MSESTNVILNGDCLEVLKTLPDNSVDSIVTDPPYGMGTREPTKEDIEAYLRGSTLDMGGDFMSYKWDIPSVPVWRECLRVLKPGGYVLSFASTRTWDVMSIGLRAAGFDNRDTISSYFGSPCLQWIQAQGFPKSMNISKELRKRAAVAEDPELKAKLLARADQFEGYGTALKPAWEPILCMRKPFSGTLADQIVQTGTGGINIDGTRVKHANAKDLEQHRAMVSALKAKGGSLGNSWKNSSDLSGANDVKEGGRWPANAVLTHAEGCTQTGTAKVDAPIINRFDDGMKPFGHGAGHAYTSMKTGDAEGKEEVALYACVEGCPVATMNAQSASAKDAGGMARFFVQFMPAAPFFYAAKASREERNEGLPKSKLKEHIVKEDVSEELLFEIEEATLGNMLALNPGDDSLDTSFSLESGRAVEEWVVQYIPEKYLEHLDYVPKEANFHPTVKPISLMKYLVKLVTPVGGVVLDPYCGSGTTCLAATEENRQFIGIERDPKFHKLATKRVFAKHKIAEIKRNMAMTIEEDFEVFEPVETSAPGSAF